MKRIRIGSLLLALLLCCFCLPQAAVKAAASWIDTQKTASLTVYFGADGRDFSGVRFRVYRVADVSESGAFTLSGDFQSYPVSLDGLSASGWRALAQTLDGYAARDDLSPASSQRTASNGKAVFDGLKPGLYLVEGDAYRRGRHTYTPEPFLVALPFSDAETGEWNYHAESSCKFDDHYNPPDDDDDDPGDDTIYRRVRKVWKDGGSEDRPKEITVLLLAGGDVYDAVTLSESNNWQYTWYGLDRDVRWRVVEDETPPGYTVSVYREGVTFLMTNSIPGAPDEPDIPDDPGNPGNPSDPGEPGTPGSPGNPGTPDDPDGPDDPDIPGEPDLPQTGTLWHLVPPLAGAGLVLLLAGLFRRRHGESREA